MHELSLAQSIVDLLEEQARRDAFSRVRSVRLSIGALAGVEPRALELGFEAAARDTVAEGATLIFERPPGRAWCTDCSAVVSVAGHGEPCPGCRGHRWIATGGEQMRVIDLEVE